MIDALDSSSDTFRAVEEKLRTLNMRQLYKAGHLALVQLVAQFLKVSRPELNRERQFRTDFRAAGQVRAAARVPRLVKS